ncbi:Uu.00g016680.m01.CDS01 [Anthostomella pinea]|uniref:Uu.00g016680.m01.CDS01 n=1 Tax=Anthostomella pinea TaxID=933095 RepID=A0AAI8YQF1_9PEZI|nr:Uu.00g016680.m01.CDS01 [Anthostomella pinea]
MASKHAWKVDLVPWDHSSPEHVERMYDQRVACGWRADEVASWVEYAKKGGRIFYWVLFSDALPDREVLLKKHVEDYPKEAQPLRDTAPEIRLVPREPTAKEFIPIGHVALDIHSAEDDASLGLPSPGTVWIHGLYISYALQGGGYGTGAMSKVEALAAQEPMNATTTALDTVSKETVDDPDIVRALNEELTSPVTSKEGWYRRQGYEVYKKGIGYTFRTKAGRSIDLIVSYMRKTLG